MSDKERVRRVQELRRSSAASPVDRTESRSVARRKAIQEGITEDTNSGDTSEPPSVMDILDEQRADREIHITGLVTGEEED